MRKNLAFVLFIVLLVALGGCQWVQQTPKTEVRVSPENSNAAEPAIAADSEGNVYVLYVEHGAEKRADVYLRKFEGDLMPTGERVRINPEAGRATAWRGDAPTIKVGADGTVYVGWTARVEVSEGSANDLYLSVSKDGGKSFDAPVKVNDDPVPAVHGMHSLEIGDNGRVFFAWLDERYLKGGERDNRQMPMDMSGGNSGEMKHKQGEPNREVYFAVSNDNGKSFSANKKIAANVCPCCKTSMTAAPDGKIYVGWRQVLEGDFRHIAVSSSIDGGSSFASPAAIVSDDRWQIVGCPVSGAGLAVDSENKLKVVWFTAGGAGTPGVYQAESTDGGKSFTPRTLISDQGASGTPIILENASGNGKAVFSAVDKNTYFFDLKNASSNTAERKQIENAELPGATVSKEKLFVAFIRQAGDKRSVFLASLN